MLCCRKRIFKPEKLLDEKNLNFDDDKKNIFYISFQSEEHVDKIVNLVKSNLINVVIPKIINDMLKNKKQKNSVGRYYEYPSCKEIKRKYIDSLFGSEAHDLEAFEIVNDITNKVNERLDPKKLINELNSNFNTHGYKFYLEHPSLFSLQQQQYVLCVTKASIMDINVGDAEMVEMTPRNCQVCEVNKRDMALNCGHIFCSKCVNIVNKCPVCREVKTTAIPVFL